MLLLPIAYTQYILKEKKTSWPLNFPTENWWMRGSEELLLFKFAKHQNLCVFESSGNLFLKVKTNVFFPSIMHPRTCVRNTKYYQPCDKIEKWQFCLSPSITLESVGKNFCTQKKPETGSNILDSFTISLHHFHILCRIAATGRPAVEGQCFTVQLSNFIRLSMMIL